MSQMIQQQPKQLPSRISSQLYNIIVHNTYPEESCTIKKIQFDFILTDRIIPRVDIFKQIKFFENHIFSRGVSGKNFIQYLFPEIFYKLFNEYQLIQVETIQRLLKHLSNFCESAESRALWLTYKNCKDISMVLSFDTQLNTFQKRWILLNSIIDKREKHELIKDVFDALKPWLDKDLYLQISEKDQYQKENAFYDDENIAEFDKQMIEKAKEAAAKQRTINDPEDLDIITIE